jgi:hypothetical protein
MSTYQNFSMPPDRFLTVSGNVLHKALIEAQRADAKRVFREICDGKRVALLNVKMDDDTEVRFDLSMDHSQFRGDRLNFRDFRSSVTSLLGAIGKAIEDKATVPMFTEEGGGTMLMGVPGLTDDTGQTNLMMLAADVRQAGCVHLKLQYMEPGQVTGQGGPDQAQAS